MTTPTKSPAKTRAVAKKPAPAKKPEAAPAQAQGQQVMIDGKPYDFSKLPPSQQGLVQQIVDVNQQMQQLQFKFTQLQVTQKAFVDLFKAEIAIEEAKAKGQLQ